MQIEVSRETLAKLIDDADIKTINDIDTQLQSDMADLIHELDVQGFDVDWYKAEYFNLYVSDSARLVKDDVKIALSLLELLRAERYM